MRYDKYGTAMHSPTPGGMIIFAIVMMLMLAISLSSCGAYKERCGRVIKTWQEGKFNDRYKASIRDRRGDVYVITLSEDEFATAQEGSAVCGY